MGASLWEFAKFRTCCRKEPERTDMEASQPSITVAIVTRNRREDVIGCVRSVMRQTQRPDQLVVVDNASEDGTAEACRKLQEEHDLQVVLCPTVGVSHARNAALDACCTDVICFLDDDSEADPEWLAVLARTFREHPEAMAVQGYIGNYYPGNTVAELVQFQRDLVTRTCVQDERVQRVEYCATGNFANRMHVVRNGGIRFDTALAAGEDIDFARSIRDAGSSIVFAAEAVIRHKWKRLPTDYLLRRFRTGVASGRMYAAGAANTMQLGVAGLEKREILQLARRHLQNNPELSKTLFYLLLFSGNLVKKIGNVYGLRIRKSWAGAR